MKVSTPIEDDQSLSLSIRAYGENESVKGVEVYGDVDSRLVKGVHTAIVVGLGINMIDADAVDAELLHELDVSGALVRVDEGILGSQLIRHS